MTPIQPDEIAGLDGSRFHEHLAPVYETVRRLRSVLPQETTLIGFCGAPWTIATYMIAGHGTTDQAPARLFSFQHPDLFEQLLNTIADHSADYLIRQIEEGADVVQIFDSWSGVLDEASFERWCVKPMARIVAKVRARFPEVPIIGFPKGAGTLYAQYRQKTGVTALGLDWSVPLTQAASLQREGAVQGNLDPMRLVAGGEALREGVAAILEQLGSGPLIFNLGHGITPPTPIAHVQAMVDQVRAGA
jgi:uroporphyrinogen decarboxylase